MTAPNDTDWCDKFELPASQCEHCRPHHVHKFEVSPRTGGVACVCGERRGVTAPGIAWERM